MQISAASHELSFIECGTVHTVFRVSYTSLADPTCFLNLDAVAPSHWWSRVPSPAAASCVSLAVAIDSHSNHGRRHVSYSIHSHHRGGAAQGHCCPKVLFLMVVHNWLLHCKSSYKEDIIVRMVV